MKRFPLRKCNSVTVGLLRIWLKSGNSLFALKTVIFGNPDGWYVNGTAILSSDLLDPTVAAECVALNVNYEWKTEEDATE